MASRFWVGGAGTWDAADTTHWAASTGGAGGQSVPGASDTVTFDGASGGGTVTVNFGGTVAITSLTFGAFTGTLDFSANNNSVTAGFVSGTGTGVRTFNMGGGTWTLSSSALTVWDFTVTTNLTFAANASTLAFAPTGVGHVIMNCGAAAITYNNVTYTGFSAGGLFSINGSGLTIASLSISGKAEVDLANAITYTIATLSLAGTPTAPLTLRNNSAATGATKATISVASGNPVLSYILGIRSIAFTGGATFAATNSFDLGNNTGVTITPPSFGGGGIISG